MSENPVYEVTGDMKPAMSQKKWLCRLVFILLGLIVFGILSGIAGYYVADGEKKTTTQEPTNDKPSGEYYIGASRNDVTGPIAQVNMMGYAKPSQNAGGLHTRLYSRAFVISDVTNQSRVVFVTVDYGMTSQVVKLRVIEELKKTYGDLYTERNVVISGSHTHSAPAGFFEYALFEVTSKGTLHEAKEAYIEGIVRSIKYAHDKMELGNIYMVSGEVDNANINRSPSSYLLNPEEERRKYKYNTDHEMTVLRLDRWDGGTIGVITWHPVHLTSMNSSNVLINSDNKGRAGMLFEKTMRNEGETLTGKERFVAAFAQGHLGDVSPNTAGPRCTDTGDQCDFYNSTCPNERGQQRAQLCVASGPGKDMFESTDIIAKNQFHAASNMYHSPQREVVLGPVSHAHQYVDMANEEVELSDGTKVKTCKTGLGYSFASGCTDGTGAFDFHQGMTEGTPFWESIRSILIPIACSGDLPDEEYAQCQAPKPVLFPTGFMDKPYPWHPHIVDVQLLRIGQLIIAAVPGEFSTMGGRRLMESIEAKAKELEMPDNTKVVIAGLSNVYTHYMVTYEEYQAQRYEAASTLFGPYTHAAYVARFTRLVENLVSGTPADPGPSPPTSQNAVERLPPPTPDYVPEGVNFGDVISDANDTYLPGETVRVKFYGANPRQHIQLGTTYLEVKQLQSDGSWTTLYLDSDWETKFIWEDVSSPRNEREENVITAAIDMVGEASGLWLDLDRARELFEKRKLKTLMEMGSTGGQSRLQELMIEHGVLVRERPPKADPETTESHVTIEWDIPESQEDGTYQIIYNGHYKNQDGVVTPFTGMSKEFKVEREY